MVTGGLNEVMGATVVVDLLLTIGTSFVVASKMVLGVVMASKMVAVPVVVADSSVEVCSVGVLVAGFAFTTS